MEAEVSYYCEDHDYVDLATLSEYFGSPEDVAKDFLSEIGVQAVNASNRTKNNILWLSISVAVAITIFAAVVETYTNYKQQEALEGYFVESITYEGDVNAYISSPTYAVEYDYNEDDSK